MKTGKIITCIIIVFLLSIYIYTAYDILHQDCDLNPPQQCYYTSNNIRDNNYTDCITTQYSQKNFIIFLDNPRMESCLYNGQRINIEFKETKYVCSDSNRTADYRACK